MYDCSHQLYKACRASTLPHLQHALCKGSSLLLTGRQNAGTCKHAFRFFQYTDSISHTRLCYTAAYFEEARNAPVSYVRGLSSRPEDCSNLHMSTLLSLSRWLRGLPTSANTSFVQADLESQEQHRKGMREKA